MTDFEVLGTVAIGEARSFILAISGSCSKNSKKKDEKIEKKILTLFERTRIGRVVERSWKKSLEKVKNHKKAIYAKTFLPLFERTGPEIGQDVETSWKKSLKMVKIHKKAIYAKTFSFTKKSLMG